MTEPLSSQLSRAFTAFTIEADDEFEHRVPHKTTNHGLRAEPGDHPTWLVSLQMWWTCVRFVPAEGTTVGQFARSAWWLTPKGISTTLRRMGSWWGYLAVDSPADDTAQARLRRQIRLTPGGQRARQAWEPLTGEIEARWRDRFGAGTVEALTRALADLSGQFEDPVPDCLRLFECDLRRRAPGQHVPATSLPGLLAQVIGRFELDFEDEHPVPLRICANVLRVLGDEPAAVKDLAARTGLDKAGVEGELRDLEQRKLAVVGPDPAGGRLRVTTLTRAGASRRLQAAKLAGAIEDRWRDQYGKERLAALADALAPVVGDPQDRDGPLWQGLYRYGDGWRSSLPRPATLPRHPAISHRGGYPDGA